MVVGRRVLGAFVSAMCGGTGVKRKATGDDAADDAQWAGLGQAAFAGEKGGEVRSEVVDAVLSPDGMAGWCEEQVRILTLTPSFPSL